MKKGVILLCKPEQHKLNFIHFGRDLIELVLYSETTMLLVHNINQQVAAQDNNKTFFQLKLLRLN